MPTIDIKNTAGKKVGSIDLADAVFGAAINEHLLWEVVKWQRAKKHRGTHSTKTVAEVRGTGKKPYKQKGTGNARQGSLRSHHHVGGGKAFGPKPRSYEYRLPKKVRKGALCSALSLRVKEHKLVVLDSFDLKAPKTREVAAALDRLGADRALIVDRATNEALRLGTGNLTFAKWIAPEGLNVYDVLNHDTLVMTSEAVKALEKALLSAGKKD